MLGLGPKEILILNGLIALLFGSKKIPELTKIVGDTIVRLRYGPAYGIDDMTNKTDTRYEENNTTNKTGASS